LRQISAGDRSQLQPVVTVALDVESGRELEAKSLKLAHYRPQDVPKGALTSIDDAVGCTALVPLVTGEPIVSGKITGKGVGSGLAVMVPDGMRAFTIQTPQLTGEVGGFIKPGFHVDVLMTSTQSGTNDSSEGYVTTTLLQDIRVLAVAQKLEPGEDVKKSEDKEKKVEPDELKTVTNVRSVTLLVTPDQAAKLDLGMNRGLLHLSLRNPADHRAANASRATMRELPFYSENPLSMMGDFMHHLSIPTGFSTASAKAVPTPAAAAATMMKVADAIKGNKPAAAQAPAPAYAEIRTLRGVDAGAVRIEVPQRAPGT
jgi:pilus assembly protein CpaB